LQIRTTTTDLGGQRRRIWADDERIWAEDGRIWAIPEAGAGSRTWIFLFYFLLMEAGIVSCPSLKQTFTEAGYLTAAVVS
jgi:hypothetical protein